MSDITRTVSPEYRAKCIEWALRTQPAFDIARPGKAVAGAEAIIDAAKKYYEYVYGDGSNA